MNRFMIADPKKCIGCRTCEIACVVAHERVDGLRTLEDINKKDFGPRIHVMVGDNVTTAVTCRQCEDSPCANACPNGAISRQEGVMVVDQNRCIGCQTCVVACPFGAMDVVSRPVFNSNGPVFKGSTLKSEAHKCDLCITRPEGPSCMQHCPTDAIFIVDPATRLAMNAEKRRKAALDNIPELI